MNEKKKQKNKQIEAISQELSVNRTYGEKVHHAFFDIGINFLLNLSVSALFTHWVSHSPKEFKLFGKSFEAPSIIQRKVGKFIHDLPIMRLFGEKTVYNIRGEIPTNNSRVSVATTMAQVFTLTAAGHPIMIPSIWLGAKVKAPMVEWLNRKHYGAAAMESDDMQRRQALLEAQERPTLLGSVTGRLGTILATQTVGYSIGNARNIFGFVGRKFNVPLLRDFKGLDAVTEWVGEKGGGVMRKLMPQKAEQVDIVLRDKHQFRFSANQESMAESIGLSLKNQPYGTRLLDEKGKLVAGGGGFEHFGRYLVSDILYTIVTASTIMPAINLFKKYVPGLTWQPPRSEKTQALLDKNPPQQRAKRLVDYIPEESLNNAPSLADKVAPATRVRQISTSERIATPSPEPQVSA